jgi:hypothetical protein
VGYFIVCSQLKISMDILDTRDLDERLEELLELEATWNEAKEALTDAEASLETARLTHDEETIEQAEVEVEEYQSDVDEAELDSDDTKELEELKGLKEEISEWHSGTTLIPESDFEDYSRDLCEDIGDIPKDFPDYIVINWKATSNNLRADYSEIEYKGENYLYRC